MIKFTARITSNEIGAIRGRLRPAAQAMAERVAEVAAERAREIVPVQTGRLRDSIAVETTAKGAAVFSDVSYAPIVEFGGHGRPPKPFMGQAAEDTAQRKQMEGFDLERYLG